MEEGRTLLLLSRSVPSMSSANSLMSLLRLPFLCLDRPTADQQALQRQNWAKKTANCCSVCRLCIFLPGELLLEYLTDVGRNICSAQHGSSAQGMEENRQEERGTRLNETSCFFQSMTQQSAARPEALQIMLSVCDVHNGRTNMQHADSAQIVTCCFIACNCLHMRLPCDMPIASQTSESHAGLSLQLSNAAQCCTFPTCNIVICADAT